jgi:glycosyltransferase involved in cell wall biosynthesis
MSDNPAISVIIPVYNTEKYLPRCLDSVLAQTFKDFEIICLNDGSADNSAKILSDYAQKDPRIKIITQTNQGLSEARNVGIKFAKGQYISFVDSDDSIHMQLLEICDYFIKKHNADLVCFGYSHDHKVISENNYIISCKNIKFRKTNEPLFCFENGGESCISSLACTKIYKSELLLNERFIPKIYAEDLPFNLLFLKKQPKTVILYKPLYYYRVNELGIRNTVGLYKKTNDIFKCLDEIELKYKDAPEREKRHLAKRVFFARFKELYKDINACKDLPLKNELFKNLAKHIAEYKQKNLFKIRSFSISDIKWFLRFKCLTGE